MQNNRHYHCKKIVISRSSTVIAKEELITFMEQSTHLFQSSSVLLCLEMLTLLLVLPLVSTQQFTPGCSFFNGQCVYNVKLGHSGHCDNSASHTTQTSSVTNTGTPSFSGDCTCADIASAKNDISALQGSVSNLQNSVDQLNKQLNLTNNNLIQTNSSLQTENGVNANLLSMLQSKETMLNKTKEELATVLLNANNEIQNLRNQLNNASKDLSHCQGIFNPNGHVASPALDAEYTTYYCPFELSSLCGFVQDHNENAEWSHTKSHRYASTGPVDDHTYGVPSGYYMLLDSRNVATSSGQHTARLISKYLDPAPNYCIRFWYNMHGVDIRTLNVYAKVGGGYGYPIFTKKGQVDKYWHMAEIPIDHEYTGSQFQIVFEALTDATKRSTYHSGGHYTYQYSNEDSDIAIDDFYAYNTTCNGIPACPPNSIARNYRGKKSCITFNTAAKSWYDANQECKTQSSHGHLMTIPDGETQQYLIRLIQSDVALMTAGQSGFYVNANDEASEGTFVWTDTGTPYPVNYTNWHQGQPNNVGSAQDCVLLEYPDSDYEWGDVRCSDKHPFICEFNY